MLAGAWLLLAAARSGAPAACAHALTRAPSRRQARDAYYACADSGSALPCWRARRAFTSACPSAWVKHFDKKREERDRVAAALQLAAQPRFKQPQKPQAAS